MLRCCCVVFGLSLVLACDRKDEPPPAAAKPASAPVSPTPAGSPAGSVAAPPVDPFAQGFCAYTVGSEPENKGGGGANNVQSTHWMAPDQPGRSIAGKLLINCGKGAQVTIQLHNDDDDLPMAPGKYPIDKTGAKGTFSVIAPLALVEPGELDITAWDRSHIAGTFRFKADKGPLTGTFDLRCPYGATPTCAP